MCKDPIEYRPGVANPCEGGRLPATNTMRTLPNNGQTLRLVTRHESLGITQGECRRALVELDNTLWRCPDCNGGRSKSVTPNFMISSSSSLIFFGSEHLITQNLRVSYVCYICNPHVDTCKRPDYQIDKEFSEMFAKVKNTLSRSSR